MAHFTRTDIRFQGESNLTPSRTDRIRFQILVGQIFDEIFLMNEKLFVYFLPFSSIQYLIFNFKNEFFVEAGPISESKTILSVRKVKWKCTSGQNIVKRPGFRYSI